MSTSSTYFPPPVVAEIRFSRDPHQTYPGQDYQAHMVITTPWPPVQRLMVAPTTQLLLHLVAHTLRDVVTPVGLKPRYETWKLEGKTHLRALPDQPPDRPGGPLPIESGEVMVANYGPPHQHVRVHLRPSSERAFADDFQILYGVIREKLEALRWLLDCEQNCTLPQIPVDPEQPTG